MAQQTINIGTVANDNTGDSLRAAGDKINDNFTENYASISSIETDVSNLEAKTKSVYLPIEFFEDGTVAPAAAELFENTNYKQRGRKFSGTADNDVYGAFYVPYDMDTSEAIQYRVWGVISEATGPSSEGMVFELSGYGAADNADGNQSFGTAVEIDATGLTYSQNDIFVSDWSGDVTISNLSNDTDNMLFFQRLATDGNDTYAQDFLVTKIQILYTARVV